MTVLCNAFLGPDTLEYCITKSDCKLVFLDEERARGLESRLPNLKRGGVETCVVVRPKQKRPDFHLLEEQVKPFAGRLLPEVDIEPEDDCTVFFTSGTTGMPKGVISSQ